MINRLRLFHVSEESNISVFYPRVPIRRDLDPSRPLVWAICEEKLVNFLTPRDCPRVCYHKTGSSADEDLSLFSYANIDSCICIENIWYEKMADTVLYLYEFDPAGFYLQDVSAGYYVSEKVQTPLSVTKITNLFAEIIKRNCEIRILPNLWPLADKVASSHLHWSLCRMKNALPRP